MFAILIGAASLASIVVFVMGERLIGGLWFGYNIAVLFTARYFAGVFGFFWYVMILAVLAFAALLLRDFVNSR